MRSATKVFAGAVIGVAMLAPGIADAGHAWGSYHWERSSNPVVLDVGDNVSSLWDAHLATAVGDWNTSEVLELSVANGKAKRRCRATAGRIEVCNDSYGNNGWLGLASISVSGDHIKAATAKMNDTYFSAPPYNTSDWRQFVVCQEIGHGFGLGHQDEDFDNANLGSCMDYTNDPGANLHPNGHDYDQLNSIYAQLDGGSDGGDGGGGGGGGGGACPPRKPGCAGGNNGPPGSDLSSPSEWGKLVSSEGRTAVYERDFGHGNRVITFVIWA
jgi:hypothetical protein